MAAELTKTSRRFILNQISRLQNLRDGCFKSDDMQLDHLAEMKAIDGKRDRQWKQARTAEQSPEKEPPVVYTFDAADS